jgi:hypothetical protein
MAKIKDFPFFSGEHISENLWRRPEASFCGYMVGAEGLEPPTSCV